MKSSAKKVELASVDDLFSTEESRADAQREKVVEIPLSELHPFKGHPFKVKDDEAIDNALAQMPQRLEAAKAQLDNLYQQQAAAKEEVGKPFLYEEELRSKNDRLVELDTLLNIDGKGQAHAEAVVAKSTRPSVLDSLKRPVTPRSIDKKPKQHEEVR